MRHATLLIERIIPFSASWHVPRHRSRFSLYIKRCFAIGGAAKWSILGVLFPLALAKVAPYGSKFRHAHPRECSRSPERNAAAFARSKGNTQIPGEARQLLPQFRSRTQLRTPRLYFCRETRNRCGTARVAKIPSRVRDCERNACDIVVVLHRRRGTSCNSRPGLVWQKRLFGETAWIYPHFLSLPNSETWHCRDDSAGKLRFMACASFHLTMRVICRVQWSLMHSPGIRSRAATLSPEESPFCALIWVLASSVKKRWFILYCLSNNLRSQHIDILSLDVSSKCAHGSSINRGCSTWRSPFALTSKFPRETRPSR